MMRWTWSAEIQALLTARDPSRVRDQYQPALHICTLDSLMGCDHFLQRQARRDHRPEVTGGE